MALAGAAEREDTRDDTRDDTREGARESARSGTGLPAGPLLAYSGDDFTGSTDVLDAFTAAGVPTVLFVEPPRPEDLRRFPQARCIGLAGTARSRSPAWMDAHLPGAFAALAQLGAPILHYKVCSTFDSAPGIGSIGRAIDLGVQQMRGAAGARWSPTVVGAPRLRRYQAFGHLFAAAGDGQVHRLDRHPTMSQHPVTPMHEADLRRHLARQTARRIELIDFTTLRAGRGAERLATLLGDDVPVVLLDVLDDETLAEVGRLVWQTRGDGLFSASSSGLPYALAAHWQREGWIAAADGARRDEAATEAATEAAAAGKARRVVALSGSCSPVTAAQIATALATPSFEGHRIDVGALLADGTATAEVERLVATARRSLAAGRHPLIYSAAGPDDPAVAGFAGLAGRAGLPRDEAGERIGRVLGEVLHQLLEHDGDIGRLLVAGGDSSGAVVQALGLRALTVARALAPGAPLCRAHADDARRDGLELVLKGGQMGTADFFARAAA